MKQVPMKLGPVALLLTVISICLTVMAILTFSTANADKAMAEGFAQSTQIRYALEQEGQKFLQQADETLAAGGSLEDIPEAEPADGGVERTLENRGYQLNIRLEESGEDGYAVAGWSLEKKWEEQETIDGLWVPSF